MENIWTQKEVIANVVSFSDTFRPLSNCQNH
nr:MAG TPA: hypothetical protein [Caudoviricetes sp.]